MQRCVSLLLAGLGMSPEPEIRVEDGVTVVALGPAFAQIDERIVDQIRESLDLDPYLAQQPLLVIDLSYTRFFGSSFIEILFGLWTKLNGIPGGRFALSGVTPYCREVLKVTHLDTLWGMYGTSKEAVEALRSAPVA